MIPEYQWFHQWRNAAHKLILQKKCKAMIFVIVWKLLNKAKYRFPMDEKKIKDVHNVDKSLKKIGTIRRDLMDNLTDRKSTRLNSSHVAISYAVFCLKKKKNNYQ